MSKFNSAFDRWTKKPARVTAAPQTQDKPLSLDAPDVCPYCGQKMRATMATGVPAFICDDDRHVSPAANAETQDAQ